MTRREKVEAIVQYHGVESEDVVRVEPGENAEDVPRFAVVCREDHDDGGVTLGLFDTLEASEPWIKAQIQREYAYWPQGAYDLDEAHPAHEQHTVRVDFVVTFEENVALMESIKDMAEANAAEKARRS